MLKVEKKSLLKSRTSDNFPYLEVFSESNKKVVKGKIIMEKFILKRSSEGKRQVLLSQNVKVIYGNREIINSPEEYKKLLENENMDLIQDYQRKGTYIFSKRYTFIQAVPDGLDLDILQERLNTQTTACLYSIISNHPIEVDPTSKEAITQLMVYDYYEDNHKKGDLMLDKYGKPQYRVIRFSMTKKSDIDLRSSLVEDYTLPPHKQLKSKL